MNEPRSVERHRRIRDLFEEVVALPKIEQAPFLNRACGEDDDLRQELTTLLHEADSEDSSFDGVVNDVVWNALESLEGDPSKLEIWLDDTINLPPDDTDTLIGKIVAHFEILESIGRGGMGVVYRAHDLTLNRTVALKLLPPSLGSDQAVKERFINEAKAASGLNHPNIATVYEIGETESQQLYISMGYYPGKTLKETIAQDPIAPDTVIDQAIQLAEGLKKAHEQGVIHRDIKPGNIMITQDGSVVLLDFGLAKLSYETGYTQLGQMAGTIAYMSPEQARGEANDPRTDIWSFGVVLYEMLTGKRPFEGANIQSTIRAILEKDPEPPSVAGSDIPRPLHDILGRCLAKDPNLRYPHAGDLLEDLQRAREGLYPKTRSGRATWNRRRRRRRWALASASLILLFVALFLIQTSRQSSTTDTGIPVNSAPFQETVNDAEAIRILEALWDQSPDSARAFSLASIYEKTGNQFAEAIMWYRRAHALDPANQEVAVRIANLHLFLGDVDNAIWWIQRSLNIAPDSEVSGDLKIKLHLIRGEALEALEYFHAQYTDDAEATPAILLELLQALLDNGHAKEALALCEQYLSPYLNLPDSQDETVSFTVVDDPFNLGQSKVLAFAAGQFQEDLHQKFPDLYISAWATNIRSAAYRLPPSATITAPASGQGKSTLYLKVGRPSVEGRPREINMVWGLATSEGFSEYAIPYYPDLSVHSRYEQDGIMDIRDGDGYVDLTQSALETDTYYELWYVINHAHNTYDLHVRGGSEFPEQTTLFTGAKYRKQTRQALDYLVLIGNQGREEGERTSNDPIYFDDFYIDPRHKNLNTPDSQWLLIDDFEEDDLSGWLRRLQRSDRILDISHIEPAFLVARTLLANGEKAQADPILDTIEVAIASTWLPDSIPNLFRLSRLHALQGNRGSALEGLETLIDSGKLGWYLNGLFERSEFSNYREAPAFQKLAKKVTSILSEQQARITQMDLRGDLATIPALPREKVARAQVTFTRVTEGDIVEQKGTYLGAAWGDYDNDGFIDVAMANQSQDKGIYLYRNRGDGSFHRITDGPHVEDVRSANFPSWADQDNDGDLDLFVTTGDNLPNAFYRNDGAGNFTQVLKGDWVNWPCDSMGATWGDYDNDGFLDVFVSNNAERNFLYHNEGNGTMSPVNTEANEIVGYTRGTLWTDYDGDGDLDLFISGHDRIQWRNDGDGVFTWITQAMGGIPRLRTFLDMGFSSADYDNDGDLDLLYSYWKPDPSYLLYRNEGEKGFVNWTRALPSAGSIEAMTSTWGDYDNDGYQDLFVANHSGKNLLYHNEGNGRFTRIVEDPVVSESLQSGFSTWVDCNNDGYLDLFITSGLMSDSEQSNEFYLNKGGTNNWILLKLAGTISNRSAIGAKVRAMATIGGQPRTQMREIGIKVNSWDGLHTHFGLGDATTIDTLRIEWPSGHVQELHDVAANQILTIIEDTNAPRRSDE